MGRKSKKQDVPTVDGLTPAEVERLDRLFEDDEELRALVKLMSQRVCDYCEAQLLWRAPDEIARQDPQSFVDVLRREDLAADDIDLAWECTECENFALISEDFEAQWLDAPAQCLECESYGVALLDPAQVASINRARYLEVKKLVGAEALLGSQAMQCHDCGAIDFLPVSEA